MYILTLNHVYTLKYGRYDYFNRDVSALAAGGDDSDSESESEENGVIGTSSSSENSAAERNGVTMNNAGVTNGSTTDDTDEEDDEKVPVTNGLLETEPKKVSDVIFLVGDWRTLICAGCHCHDVVLNQSLLNG